MGVVRCFVELVTETALVHSGQVKDYEGDGALLYFESPRQAVRAALAIRAELAQGRCDTTCGGGPGMKARMSLALGEVVMGAVGSSTRHGIALVGPSVNVGSRLLRQVSPGGIIATGELLEALRAEAPHLAGEFRLLDSAFEVPGADGLLVTTHVVRPAKEATAEQR